MLLTIFYCDGFSGVTKSKRPEWEYAGPEWEYAGGVYNTGLLPEYAGRCVQHGPTERTLVVRSFSVQRFDPPVITPI
jgi:hypothetical protein